MPELRQNFFTKEWVIIATERAKRPEDLATHRVADPVPEFVESCPFCPGNESKTPPEVLRCPSNSERWDVRVIPNKFAALSSEAQPTRSLQHLRRRIEGFGFHEVIIDSPDHSRYMGLLSVEALRHYDNAGECMFCHMVEREVEDQTRVVLKSERFVAMEVFAAATPFATHIFPLRHMASFGDISEMEIVDLARVLRTLLAKIYVGLGNPDLNFMVRSGPAEYAGARHFHWYVSVIPRLTRVAGFELGSGMFINTVLPEAAAEFLRKVTVEKVAGAGAGQ